MLYRQLAESTNNQLALKVINEVVEKNNLHVDESLKLLRDLVEDEKKVVAQKARDDEEIKHIQK